LIPELLDLRLRLFEKRKDAAGCRTTAETWEKLRRTDADGLYNAACARAVVARILRAGARSAAAGKEAEAEGDRAMAWLERAVAAGYDNAAHLARVKDLDSLRDRKDFQDLLARLEARQKKR
jgi:hypothetical protein